MRYPPVRLGAIGPRLAMVAVAATIAVPGGSAPLPPLPTNLGPPVRVGLDVGAASVPYLSVTAVADPDLASAATPGLTVALAPSAAVADSAADGAVALSPAAASAQGVVPTATPIIFGTGTDSVWFASLDAEDLVVLASGLDAAAAANLAGATPGATVAALGPGGDSVVAPSGVVGTAGLHDLRLVASGALVGPYSNLGAAQAEASNLNASGLWAVPDLQPGTGGSGTWYVRVLGSASAASRSAAAQGAVEAADAAVSGGPAGPAAQPVLSSPSLVMTVANGSAVLAPAAWAMGEPGALEVQAGGSVTATTYAGALIVSRPASDPGIQVVNDVPLERYVAGVVPLEMPPSWAQQALEAQAIACRTYALWALDTRSPGTSAYVLVSTPADQAYGGLSAETPATDAATWATNGQVVTYDNLPIDALYEADSGGYTASSVDVWGNAVPYLTAHPEPKGYVSPDKWSVALSGRALAAAAAAAGTPTGVVQAVTVVAREAGSGRVIGLLLIGPTGQVELRDDSVRTALGLPSNLFSVHTATQVTLLGADGARTTLLGLAGAHVAGARAQTTVAAGTTVAIAGAAETATLGASPSRWVFSGSGDGPGLGMSQWGAEYMAAHGATAAAILLYYYRGTTLRGEDGEGAP